MLVIKLFLPVFSDLQETKSSFFNLFKLSVKLDGQQFKCIMVYGTLPPFGRYNTNMHIVYYTFTAQT